MQIQLKTGGILYDRSGKPGSRMWNQVRNFGTGPGTRFWLQITNDIPNGVIFNDLEWLLTQISRHTII